MNEYLMRAYLRSKRSGMTDSEFMRKMKEVSGPEKYVRGRGMRRDSMGDPIEDKMYDDFYINRHGDTQLVDMMDELDSSDKDRLFRMMLEGDGDMGNHFSESTAKYLVSQMYHTSGGRKFIGEKYDMSKAKEVAERYRGIIPQSATCADVYVALNAQYHDYCELLKVWFGDNIDTKVVESAINFWFKDDDYKSGDNKVYKYFRGA
jgi:hypothetical protein